MTIKERLHLIVKELKLSGRQFEKECELANGSYASLGDRMGADKLNKILIRFPQISADWLLTGRGEMFISPSNLSDNIPNYEPSAEPEGITISHEILSVLQQQASALLSQQNTIAELVRQNGEHILLEQQLSQSKRVAHQGDNAACADVG